MLAEIFENLESIEKSNTTNMIRKIITTILLMHSVLSISQSHINYKGESINALDENGNKIGLWKLYLDFKNVLVTIDYSKSSRETIFYKDSVLIATYNTNDNLKIFKDSKTVNAKYFYQPDHSRTLVTEDGKELNPSIIEYYSPVDKISPDGLWRNGLTLCFHREKL